MSDRDHTNPDPKDEPLYAQRPPDRDPADIPEWMEKTAEVIKAVVRGIENLPPY